MIAVSLSTASAEAEQAGDPRRLEAAAFHLVERHQRSPEDAGIAAFQAGRDVTRDRRSRSGRT